MSRRMENKIEDILSEEQFEFKKNMGTREAKMALRTIIEKRIRKDKPANIAFYKRSTMSTGQKCSTF